MYRLLEFLRSIYVALLFIIIEAVAIGYYARSSQFTQARILTQSNRLVGGIHGAFHNLKHFFTLPAENRQLLERVVSLENELSLYREQAVYHALDTLASPLAGPYQYTSARVVANSINKQENFITLNKGLDYDVSPEMAVITPAGEMVGYVASCSDRYSVAVSILNTSFRASGEVLGELLSGLTRIGVSPYYIFQCRPVTGVTGRFQVPIAEGIGIVDDAKSRQNGIGKSVRYAMSHPRGKIEIIGRLPSSGETVFKFHQAKYDSDMSRIFTLKLDGHETWLDDELHGI